MDLAAVLEITAAETDVDATLSGSCCFYAAVAAAMADVEDSARIFLRKSENNGAFMRPCFHFGKTPFSSFRSSPLLFPAL